jgi:phage terminase large subunit
MDFDPDTIKGQPLCGLDFGYTNDPTAFTASTLVESERRIYIFKEWGGTGYLNDAIADQIKEMGFAKSIICADSAE